MRIADRQDRPLGVGLIANITNNIINYLPLTLHVQANFLSGLVWLVAACSFLGADAII